MSLSRYIAFFLLALPLVAHASHFKFAGSHDHAFLSRRDHSQLAHRTNPNNLKKRCRPTRRNVDHALSLQRLPSGESIDDSITKIAGLLNVKSNCGNIGATKEVTANSGPNGSEDWLNCGINDGGWRPPYVRVDDLITEDLSDAIKMSSSPFKACQPFVQLFDKHGQENGVPSILLAAFALQESSCKPGTTGGAGEQGLMQLTKDKCGGAPGGNCKDPDFNIRIGAKFFADTLASNGGNVIETIGMYNGWRKGLTYAEATAAGYSSCCRCQNNLDYIHQFVNGWLQNKNVYGGKPRIGVYFNLDKCGN